MGDKPHMPSDTGIELPRPSLAGTFSVCSPSSMLDVRPLYSQPALSSAYHSMSTITILSDSNCSSIAHNHHSVLSRSTSSSASVTKSPSVTTSVFDRPLSPPSVCLSYYYNTNPVGITKTSSVSSSETQSTSSISASNSCSPTVVTSDTIHSYRPCSCVDDAIDSGKKLQLHIPAKSISDRSKHAHSWSKSETNLCGQRLQSRPNTMGSDTDGPYLSAFGVVSLNDLQETEEVPFSQAAGHQMNDLSKYNPTLNNISNDDLFARPK